MARDDTALMAHLMRRAGFGASREELEAYTARGYEAVVDDLLHPERFPQFEDDLVERYFGWDVTTALAPMWIYRMVNTRRPLEEKIALLWHHVFATGWFKSEHQPAMNIQIDTFRRVGLSNLRTILLELSRDPAMLFWLDNNENHKDEPNENYGRELLELFSMGVGNYTEEDLKTAARAFTGWTFTQPIPLYPNGHYEPQFLYRQDDHDDSVKTFLGNTGRLNGEDIIDIIVRQPAAARFISRHLYNFFVADEPQVPAWIETPPRNPETIDAMTDAYFSSGGEISAVLRVMFDSQAFKEAVQMKVKSPAELVTGVIKLVGTYRFPEVGFAEYGDAAGAMGQELLNPPTVEGWHTGKEWIDGGTLNERVNFAVNEVGDVSKPGVQDIIARLKAANGPLSPGEFVDRCLELAGPVDVGEKTRSGLVGHAESGGSLRFESEADQQTSAARIGRMLQLIVASREYQFA